MKVKAKKTSVRYNDRTYAKGEVFDITKKDYEEHQEILEVVEEDKISGKSGDTSRTPKKETSGKG